MWIDSVAWLRQELADTGFHVVVIDAEDVEGELAHALEGVTPQDDLLLHISGRLIDRGVVGTPRGREVPMTTVGDALAARRAGSTSVFAELIHNDGSNRTASSEHIASFIGDLGARERGFAVMVGVRSRPASVEGLALTRICLDAARATGKTDRPVSWEVYQGAVRNPDSLACAQSFRFVRADAEVPAIPAVEPAMQDSEPLPSFSLDAPSSLESQPLPSFALDTQPPAPDEPLPSFALEQSSADERQEPLPSYALDSSPTSASSERPLPSFESDPPSSSEYAGLPVLTSAVSGPPRSIDERITQATELAQWPLVVELRREKARGLDSIRLRVRECVAIARVLQVELDDSEGALASLDEARRLDPTRVGVLQALRRGYERVGRWEAAFDTIGALVDLSGSTADRAELRYAQARVALEQLQDRDRALVTLRAALQCDPAHERAQALFDEMCRVSATETHGFESEPESQAASAGEATDPSLSIPTEGADSAQPAPLEAPAGEALSSPSELATEGERPEGGPSPALDTGGALLEPRLDPASPETLSTDALSSPATLPEAFSPHALSSEAMSQEAPSPETSVPEELPSDPVPPEALSSEAPSSDPPPSQDIVDETESAIFDVEDPATHASAFETHRREGRTDAALLAALALEELGAADVDQQVLVDQFRSVAPVRARGTLDDLGWQLLRMDPSTEALTALFAAVARSAITTRLEQLVARKRLVTLDPVRRLDEASTASVVRSFQWAARVLGVPCPSLYTVDDVPGDIAAVRAKDPSTALGPAVLRGRSAKELAFLAARHVTYYRPEHQVLVYFPTGEDLGRLLAATIHMAAPGTMAGASDRSVVTLRERLERHVTKAELSIIASASRGLAQGANLASWARGVELTAGRAGLLLCGDLATATSIVRSESRPIAGLTGVARRYDLIAFCASTEHAELRTRFVVTAPESLQPPPMPMAAPSALAEPSPTQSP